MTPTCIWTNHNPCHLHLAVAKSASWILTVRNGCVKLIHDFSFFQCLHRWFWGIHQTLNWPLGGYENQSLGRVSNRTVSFGFFGFLILTKAVFAFIRVIRELATKALHNLTAQAPEYMANTGENSVHFVSYLFFFPFSFMYFYFSFFFI